jgi:hypothetical protein
MTRLQWARLIVAGVGLVIWVYGLREDHDAARWIGIVVFASSIAMRWLDRDGRGRGRPSDPPE